MQHNKTENIIITIELSKIVKSDDFRCREVEDTETIEGYTEVFTEYKDAKDNGNSPEYPFPPIWVMKDQECYVLVTGYHRFESAVKAGMKEIQARQFQGTKEEAILFAMKDNKTNGLRLKYGDWKYCIAKALRMFPHKTAGAIAKELGCHRSYVYRIEKELSTNRQLPKVDKKKGADGKTRKTNKESKITKEAKQEIETVQEEIIVIPDESEDQLDWEDWPLEDRIADILDTLDSFLRSMQNNEERLQLSSKVYEWASRKCDRYSAE